MTVTSSKQLFFSLHQRHSSNLLVISLHPHSTTDHRPTVQKKKLTYREDAKLYAQSHCLSAARATTTPWECLVILPFSVTSFSRIPMIPFLPRWCLTMDVGSVSDFGVFILFINYIRFTVESLYDKPHAYLLWFDFLREERKELSVSGKADLAHHSAPLSLCRSSLLAGRGALAVVAL